MTNGSGFSGQDQTSRPAAGAAQSPLPVNAAVMLAQTTAGAAPAVVVVELEAGGIARLPAGTDISQARANGTDLEFVQPDGTVIVIPGGAIANLVLFVGDIQIPADVVVLMFEVAGIEPKAGPEGGADGAHGSFVDLTRQTVGDGLARNNLLGDSSLTLRGAEGGAQLRDNTVPGFAPEAILVTLSEEGFVGGLQDGIGSPSDESDVAEVRNIGFGLRDNEGHDLSYTMLAAPTVAWTSGGHPIAWTLDASGTLLVGSTVDGPVITIAFDNATDSYTVTLTRPLDHPYRDAEDRLELTLDIRVSDYQNWNDGKLVLRIEDDSPEQSTATIAHGRADEHELATSNASFTQLGAAEFWAAPPAGVVLAQGDLKPLVNAGGDGYGDNGFHLVDKDAAEAWLKDGHTSRFASQGDAVDRAEFLDVPGLGQVLGFFAADGRLVFGLQVAEGGGYNFALFDQLDHALSDDPATPATEGAFADTLSLDLSSLITFTDGDGNSLAISAGRVIVDIVDDVPVAIARAFAKGAVQEDALSTAAGDLANGHGNHAGEVDAFAFTQTALRALILSAADKPVTFALATAAAGQVTLTNGAGLTSHGQAVLWGVQDGTVFGYIDSDGVSGLSAGDRVVFTVKQPVAGGDIVFDLLDGLDHAAGADDKALITLDLTPAFVGKDFDGDQVTLETNSIRIEVENDLPVAVGATGSGSEDTLVGTDNIYGANEPTQLVINTAAPVAAPAPGADGWFGGEFGSAVVFESAPTVSVHWGGVSYAVIWNLTTPTTGPGGAYIVGTVTFQGQPLAVALLQVNIDGSVTYKQNFPLRHVGSDSLDLTFTYALKDGDGSKSAPQTVKITIADGLPTAASGTLSGNESVMVPVDHERGGTSADTVIDITGSVERPTPGADGWAGGSFATAIKFVGPFPELAVHVGGTLFPLTFTQVDNVLVGRWRGVDVVALQINEDGSTRYVQNQPIYNSGASDLATALAFKYTLTDGDGDTTAAQTVTVTVTDDTPTVAGNAVSVSEDLAPFAIDLDFKDSYGADGKGSIALAAQNAFTVTPGQGVATFTPVGSLNAATGVYTITNVPANWFGSIAINYVISDADGDSRPGTSTLTITAVNDAPVVTSAATALVAENTATTAIVYQVTQTDVDSASFTYSLSGADADRFTIDAGGAVRFKASPDYELPADAGGNNVYDLIVNVSDGFATTPKAVAITVTDVAEAVAPTGADGTVVTNEDTARAFQAADFGYADANGDAFTSVIINTATLPVGSALLFNGGAYQLGTAIAYAQIGQLVFRPTANANGDSYAAVTFRVGDATGRYDAVANTLTVNVTPVNDAPTLSLSEPIGGAGSVSDDFSSRTYSGGSGNVSLWKSGWIETGDGVSSATDGDIIMSGIGDQIRFSDLNGNGASSLTSTVDLTGAVNPRLSFDYQRIALDDADPKFLVDISTDGVHWTRFATISGPDNDGGIYQSVTGIDLSGFISATTQIRFTHAGGGPANSASYDGMYLDNVRIDYAGISESKYVENASPMAVIANATIADIDDAQMERATLTLTNAQAGDRLWINGTQALNGASGMVSGVGFTVTVAGQVVTIAFAGAADKATYETILEAIRFDNSSDNPSTVNRVFQFSINDGADSSAVVPFTLQVVATNDTATIGGVATGTVNEDGTLIAGNTLTVSDADTGQNHFQTPASLAGTYGTFSFNATTGVWGYTLNNTAANVQALTSAQTVHDKLTVTSLDGTASQVIDVTIKGRDEVVAKPDTLFAPSSPGTGWVLNGANGHYYKYISTAVSWDDAVTGAAAQKAGAYLATITDASEQTFIRQLLSNGPTHLWLGLSDTAQEGIWRWMTGPEAGQILGNYQPWTTGEPNNSGGNEDHAELYPVTGTWNDVPSSSVMGYVAEWHPTGPNEDTVTTFVSEFLTINDTQAEWDVLPTVTSVSATSSKGALVTLNYDTATQLWMVSYNPTSAAALQALKGGQITTDTFTYSVSDGQGSTATSTATITVVGVNDVATITGTSAGTIKEDATLTTGGTLTVVDADSGESGFRVMGSLTGTYGTFTFNATTGVWGYTLNNAAANVQALTGAQTVYDRLEVMSLDGTVSRTVEVTINGANETGLPANVTTYAYGTGNNSNTNNAYDLTNLVFVKSNDPDVSSAATTPSLTVSATGSNGQTDHYKLVISQNNTLVRFDIDNAAFDSVIRLTRLASGFTAITSDDDAAPGEAGGDLLSHISATLSAGTYYLQVGRYNSSADYGLGNIGNNNTYELQVSVIKPGGDPIILDLDRNGFDLNGTAHFDLLADGAPRHLGWPGPGDGMLVVDLDGSGVIENGREVFSPDFGNGGHVDSLAALRTYDSDGDGKITSSDAGFGDLKVWQDLNGNGVSEAGELSSLTDLGIIGIDLGASEVDFTEDGQHVFAQGTFTMTDGTTRDYLGVDLGAPLQDLQVTQTGTDGVDHFTVDSLEVRDVIADYDFDGGDTIDLSVLLDGVSADNAGDFVRCEGDSLRVDLDGSSTAHDFADAATLSNAGDQINLVFDNGFEVIIDRT